jgi:hypothetical protein
MILKYEKPPMTGTKEVPNVTQGPSIHIVSGIDNYEYGHFKDKEVAPGRSEREMYITYHLEKDEALYNHSVTIFDGCFAFMMNDEGKTIERIR